METSKKGHDIVLNCSNLIKNYKLGGVIVPALRGMDLEVSRGQMISIMGPSGCGKTTLLNLLGGLDQPSEGTVKLEDRDIATMSDKELTKIRRHKIGFIFQTYNLLPVLTAFENVELPMLIAGVGKKERYSRTNYLLEVVGLKDRKHHKPDELSGGERQRVAIARALSNKPAIILCDEPTGDLDSETGDRIVKLLKEVNKTEGQTIIVVTHDQVVADQTEIIYRLKDGKILSIDYPNKNRNVNQEENLAVAES
ncbi:MAG: putative ABC transporter ATP-binding protein [Candidatus Heimdallarchaeota archaeon LC_3]|nr:MAG: putative ABC transporter ATP-binding protein [Candidatus Heimdallarchaeota archaeon LC_3]